MTPLEKKWEEESGDVLVANFITRKKKKVITEKDNKPEAGTIE